MKKKKKILKEVLAELKMPEAEEDEPIENKKKKKKQKKKDKEY